MDAGVVYPAEGMNKQRPPSVSIPTSGDVNESINRPSMVDQVEENITATKAPTLGAPDEKGRFTKTERQRPISPGSRPSDVAFSDVTTGSDLGPSIEISDLPLSTPRKRDSTSSTASIAGSSVREGDSSLEQMDAEISREGVPTGASGYGAGTKNVSEIHDSGIGGIKPPSDASSPPPGLPTGVDPARETKENIPTGAEDVFEPRPNPAEDEEKPTINPVSSFMETGGPEFFTGGLDPTSAPVQGNFKTHSTYNDIPVPYGNPSAALPPETSHTLIAPVLESLNQAGAPNAHIQHVEQVIYSADGVPGIGHVEGTIERLTTVDQTPNMPPRIQSGFVKPAEEASNGQKSSMRSE